jgi:hypothetical protein
VKQAPLVVWLSMIPWRSADERSEFIRVTTGRRQSRAATEQPKFPSRL